MAKRYPVNSSGRSSFSRFFHEFGWDLLLGFIVAFYELTVPYTKVEESFNVQAMHDILYHQHHIEKYDHFEFPGVVPRTFIGAFLVSILSMPAVFMMHLLRMPKVYSLHAVRFVLGGLVLSSMHFLRIQVRRKFGHHVEAFYCILTAVQFHLLFYATRPLPNIFAFSIVTLAYGFWLKGNAKAALKCLTFASTVFRCDTVLLFGPIGIELLLSKCISLWEAIKCCFAAAILSIGSTIIFDTIMWQELVWPEFSVFWFNSVLNRSSEWGTHAFHWYFSSALPRSLLLAYPLSVFGVLLDQRIWRYIAPVFSFVILYSKLPHKELRFIIGAIPIFNLSAAIAAGRVFNNRRKSFWKWLYIIMIGSFMISLGCSIITFMASYDNYPGAYALKALHKAGASNGAAGKLVHVDTHSAMNGISRFSEENRLWIYSKEEGISMDEYQNRNFSYLLSEHRHVDGFECLLAIRGFSRARIRIHFPPVLLMKEPKVFVHGSLRGDGDGGGVNNLSNWPGCP